MTKDAAQRRSWTFDEAIINTLQNNGIQQGKPFSLLIKPTSADCNLRCEYCFYLDRSALYPETKRHRMSDTVLDRMISSYMATAQPAYYFGWQGGEPTLMGVEFFRRVTEYQQKYGRRGAVVSNGLQTNATLIDDEMAAHFSKYRFLVGVSIDGPAQMHDRFRVNPAGRGSHADVLKGIDCLKRHNVEFNALVLVSSANVNRAKEVYHYLCDLGMYYHQYIPCVEFDNNGHPLTFTISAKQWGDFLCDVFAEWIRRDARRVSIRWFDSVISYLVDGSYTVCQMGQNCCQYFLVEHNGDIYPCDFFVQPELRLGNIRNTSWQELLQSQVYLDFGGQKMQWPRECDTCGYLAYCSGGCLKHRLFHGKRHSRQLSWLCRGYKQFYQHALPELKTLADTIKEERSKARIQAGPRDSSAKIGRNEPCPCGSGLKYKRCCGR